MSLRKKSEKGCQKLKRLGNEINEEVYKLYGITEEEKEIQKLDNEIDEEVYKLYGITEEEKKIIEESLK